MHALSDRLPSLACLFIGFKPAVVELPAVYLSLPTSLNTDFYWKPIRALNYVKMTTAVRKIGVDERSRLSTVQLNVTTSSHLPTCLRRDQVAVAEAAGLTSFDPPRHPHGRQPGDVAHPAVDVPRTRTLGNDNSSLTRQSRCHSSTPDRAPGTQYAGACYQKMGQLLLDTYRRVPGTVAYNGRL